MVLNLSISSEAAERLREKASAAGVDVETFAARQLELAVAPRPSVKELSGPIGDRVASSGMSEVELAELLEAEKHAMRRERRGKQVG